MLTWITANLATILVCAVLLLIVGLVLRKLIMDKKQGRSSCGCDNAYGSCSGCAMRGKCHAGDAGKT